MTSFPPVRRLGPVDLKACMDLSVDRGWAPEKRKWTLLLEAAEPFGVDAPDGRGLAGAVVLARYGNRDASVGMMLVAARYGRRGLGRTLMTHLLDAVSGATVTLFATGLGRPLYAGLGFVPVRRSQSFIGVFEPGTAAEAAAAIRPAADTDLPEILALDAAAFGADRSEFVRRLPSFADRIVIARTAGTISGYAAAWRSGGIVTIIGPVIAPDDETARALITGLAAETRGPVRLDLDPDRPGLPGWAVERGLEGRDVTTVMRHGPAGAPGNRDRIYAPITVALT